MNTSLHVSNEFEYLSKVPFKDIETYLNEGYEVEITSPDGYVPVKEYIKKPDSIGYKVEVDGNEILVSNGHLFETEFGWMSAKDISLICNEVGLDVLFEGELHPIKVTKTDQTIPIVDCVIGHKNHRYYANGISSHNTGVGKTSIKCHFAASYLMQSKNVLYLTMEMAEERIAERIDANLMNVPITHLKSLKQQTFKSSIDSIRAKTTGNLYIKQFPTAAAHVGHFRALLNELKQKKDFSPDVIFIDYLNICASSRIKQMGGSINSYSYIKSIAEEVRGLAIEQDCIIWTSTQSNRAAATATDMGIDNISESFGTAHTLDLLLGAVVTEEMRENGQIMFKQLKNRYGDLNYFNKFFLGVDFSKMKLYDLEDSSTDNNSGQTSSSASSIPTTSAAPPPSDFSGFEI